MIFVTSLITGIFAALLRSMFALISVAVLICVAFGFAAVLYGTSFMAFLLAIGGFNAGLILLAVGHMVLSGPRHSAH